MEASLERLVAGACAARGGPPRVVTSADAPIAALQAIGARRVAMITPYYREGPRLAEFKARVPAPLRGW